MPVRVTIASPRRVRGPNDSATLFSGWPSNRSRKMSDQATVNPQLAGFNGEIAMPLAARISTQAASEPSRGQLAPPQPRAQQWRGLERLRKHPARGADKGRLAQRLAPGAQALRRKCFNCISE